MKRLYFSHCNLSLLLYTALQLFVLGVSAIFFQIIPLWAVCWIFALGILLGAFLWKKKLSPLPDELHQTHKPFSRIQTLLCLLPVLSVLFLAAYRFIYFTNNPTIYNNRDEMSGFFIGIWGGLLVSGYTCFLLVTWIEKICYNLRCELEESILQKVQPMRKK